MFFSVLTLSTDHVMVCSDFIYESSHKTRVWNYCYPRKHLRRIISGAVLHHLNGRYMLLATTFCVEARLNSR